MGQEHGIGFDGLNDDRTRVKMPRSLADVAKPEISTPRPSEFITLHLRWERALPIRAAEMKAGVVEPPVLGDDGYSLAVYGIPASRMKGDPKSLGEPLKKLAILKREGKTDVRPSSVEVFQREDESVVVYVFPLSAEISKKDAWIEFEAQIGRIRVVQSFDIGKMRFQDKLEI